MRWIVASVRNKELLDGWVGYLENQAAPELVGSQAKLKILQAVNSWELLQGEELYCLECPLLGKASTGFSTQYSTNKILEGNAFSGKLGEKYNRFLGLYSQKIGPKCRFYLEVDPNSENDRDLAMFLELPAKNPEPVIRLALGALGNLNLEKTIDALFSQAQGLDPLMLGSVFTRLHMPVRICFATVEHIVRKPGRLDAMVNFLKSLANTQNIIEDLLEIEQTGLFDFCLYVDVYPNGSIGPMLGLELSCFDFIPKEQLRTLQSEQFYKFRDILLKYNLVDKRFDYLLRCCFNATLPKVKEDDKEETLLSLISRFKITYKNGERQSAKVYLQGVREE